MDPIVVDNLTKRFKGVAAVNRLSFSVRSGSVTGFLGRNGAGKTTTLRILVGLARANEGTALINGVPYNQLERPAHMVGAVLEARSFHPSRTARNHLRWVATAIDVAESRIDEVLELVGLTEFAGSRVGTYSLGMRQRLALATALLGDPGVLILDEPANGLDPQGMRWLRDFLCAQAKAGKAVLVSSHVLAELAQFADDIVIIERGRLIRQGAVAEITQDSAVQIRVRTPGAAQLAEVLQGAGGVVSDVTDSELVVTGLSVEAVGDQALAAGIAVHSLNEERSSLEDVFLNLTAQQGQAQDSMGRVA